MLALLLAGGGTGFAQTLSLEQAGAGQRFAIRPIRVFDLCVPKCSSLQGFPRSALRGVSAPYFTHCYNHAGILVVLPAARIKINFRGCKHGSSSFFPMKYVISVVNTTDTFFLVRYTEYMYTNEYINPIWGTETDHQSVVNMVRITIDKDRCTGCGLCIEACHEAAIGMRNGKAYLLQEANCDGLGTCIPVCPTGAIIKEMSTRQVSPICFAGKPAQWPLQIKLVPVQASFFEQAHVVISADCCAYTYADFYQEFVKNNRILLGCPKLDETDYSKKLGEIIHHNPIKSLQIIRMEVPCCGGIEHAVRTALTNSGKTLPLTVTTLSTDGKIIKN
ncbi:MAG: 4Fe-4S binding protein [Treponema sp.]|nr:4Fe-4S binding protein [Treponema sp.]